MLATNPPNHSALKTVLGLPPMDKIEGYTVVYRWDEDIILAEVPAIPGCFSDGRTLDEARERVRDAILDFLSEFSEAGESSPKDILHVERIAVAGR